MKRKIVVLTILSLLIVAKGIGQENMAITHTMFNKMTYNPGATGVDDGVCGTLLYRNQWAKFDGAPNSVVFNIEANLDRFISSGIGLSFFHDAIGYDRQNNLMLNYAYKLELGHAGVLGIGLGVGLMNFSRSPTWVVVDATTPDIFLPSSFSGTNLDLNFGLHFKSTKNFYVGISSTHLSQSIILDPTLTNINFNTRRHYYLSGGYRLDGLFGANREFDLDLNTLMRTDLTLYSIDLTARLFWRNLVYAGVGYRNSDAILAMIGLSKNIGTNGVGTFGYAYDITTNRFSGIAKGSHEIMLRYCQMIPPPKITKSGHPRWL